MKFLLSLLFAAALCAPALAQSPFAYGGTVGTSPITAIPAGDVQVKKLIFYNPNATGNIAFCPSSPNRGTGATIICAVNGPGSITLQPGWSLVTTTGNGSAPYPSISGGWNVVGSTSGLNWTVLDEE